MTKDIVPIKRVAQNIRHVRRQKVILDFDLAALYGVTTKALNQAVKRNATRFPADFMFQLTSEETRSLRSQFVTTSRQVVEREVSCTNWSQFVTSSSKHRGATYRPYAFTEQGVAMLSSVLNSERAVKVNIAIMRAFVKLRETLETNREFARKFSELEKRIGKHDEEITAIIEAIRQLTTPPETPRREIGFHVREKPSRYRTRKRA
jgi:hypothetical protein